LSSINGTVNDLVGPTAATAVGVAASIAAAVAVGTALPVAIVAVRQEVPANFAAETTPTTTCGAPLNSNTAQAIKQIRTLRKKVTDRLADPSKPSTSTDPQLNIYLNQISTISTKFLTIKTSYLWTPYPTSGQPTNTGQATNTGQETNNVIIDNVLRATFDDTNTLAQYWFVGADSNAKVGNFSTLPLSNQLELRFLPWSYAPSGAAPTGAETKGFVIRYPAVATLRVCGNTCVAPGVSGSAAIPPLTLSLDNTTTVAEYDNINIHQFGRRIIIPFRNEALQNTIVALTLGPDGSVTSLGTHDTGNANSVLATLGTSTQSVTGVLTSRASAISASNTAAANVGTYADSIMKAQADCLQQRNAIIAAGATPLTSCNSP
jgi:hypothetical protein